MHYIGIDIAKYNHVVGVLKKDGTPVGSKSHAESTVNTDRYQLWHLTKPADSEGRDYFDQEDAAGTYVVTIRKDGQTVSSEALVYAP